MTEKKSVLSQALEKVSASKTGGAGLAGALARKEGDASLATRAAPQGANITAVQRAVEQGETIASKLKLGSGICFVIDATGSREPSWKEAQTTQAAMFDAIASTGATAKVGVICHRGGRVEPLGWFDSADSAKARMGEVRCKTGETNIVGALTNALQGPDGKPPSSIILVGDFCEEEQDRIERKAWELAGKGVKVFAFLEGNAPEGYRAYSRIAEITGGVFKRFGEGLDLDLQDLCVAVAALDAGGKDAFDRLLATGHKGAKALEADVKRMQLGPGGPR